MKNAPTHFGTVAYEIVSDVDNGKINATVEMPSRNPPQRSRGLRLRHPKAAPIKSVTVNGKDWNDFNKDKETIELKGLTGTVAVTAKYYTENRTGATCWKETSGKAVNARHQPDLVRHR